MFQQIYEVGARIWHTSRARLHVIYDCDECDIQGRYHPRNDKTAIIVAVGTSWDKNSYWLKPNLKS